MRNLIFPLETLIRQLKRQPEYLPYALLGSVAVVVLLAVIVFYFRKYFTLVGKSLSRNLLRTLLASLATMVLVFVVLLITSVLLFIELMMVERNKDLVAVVTERYQIPSQMPFYYASDLERGAARSDHPEDVRPQDSMTWQFFIGTQDPKNKSWEGMVFMFAMDPYKVRTMMEDLDRVDPAVIERLAGNKKGVLMGRELLDRIHKRVGERFTLSSINYKEIDLEFEVVDRLPEGRYNQSAIMNRDYLNDALDAYALKHNGTKHPMATKTLNLVFLRVPDPPAFQKVADQVMTSSLFTAPFVKCETGSSSMSSWLESYQDIIWCLKWLLVPAILVTMSLIISNAISISIRERRTEMAVLKVLGYSPGRILALVLGEALLVGAGSGWLSATLSYVLVDLVMGGIKFAFLWFPAFYIGADAMWWGLLCGGLTSLVGSIVPAWSARTVKVSEVFAKVG